MQVLQRLNMIASKKTKKMVRPSFFLCLFPKQIRNWIDI
nr:MAG TPA: hypothetical protein [Caudoviricetes sp.]